MSQNRIQYTLQINEPEEYSWEFNVPPRSHIRQFESRFPNANEVKDMQFKTGLLAGIKHKGKVELTSGKIKATLELPKDDNMVKWSVTSCSVGFHSQDRLLYGFKSVAYKEQNCTEFCNWILVNKEIGPSEYWNDSATQIQICFSIEQATPTPIKIITSSTIHKKNDFSPNHKPEWNGSPNFFLSNEFSDVKFTCERIEFPSHKVILSSRSQVFNRMLHSESEMTEAKEGNIQIADMKSNVLKEMLRYMYCGEVENLEEISEELIIAADKYDLPYLKDLCEESLLEQITTQNAINLYSLAESINAKTLMEISFDCIKKNKSAIFKDSEEILHFTSRHPEVIFQLLQL